MSANSCHCPSCRVGLSCYRTSRPVVDVQNQTTQRMLWGDVIALAAVIGGAVGDYIRAQANKLRGFSFAGVEYSATAGGVQ